MVDDPTRVLLKTFRNSVDYAVATWLPDYFQDIGSISNL